MKILAGKYKSRSVETGKKEHMKPTSSRVKEAIFNILEHNVNISKKLNESIILDVFAGSGSLGIEALSRGALFCCFIDKDKEHINNIDKTLKKFNEENFHLINRNVKQLTSSTQYFDFVFLDPPYDKDLINESLEILYKNQFISKDSIIVIESDKKKNIEFNSNFKLILERTYGRSRLSFIEVIH